MSHVETNESKNQRKWLELVKMQKSTNDSFLKFFKSAISLTSVDYESCHSCKEFIHCLAEEVRATIKLKIDPASIYGLLIDECKDTDGRQQLSCLSICI